jgi:sterol desaturase/sphingolipid hydroxylase (fatty acid hydroxylase superfamily)
MWHARILLLSFWLSSACAFSRQQPHQQVAGWSHMQAKRIKISYTTCGTPYGDSKPKNWPHQISTSSSQSTLGGPVWWRKLPFSSSTVLQRFRSDETLQWRAVIYTALSSVLLFRNLIDQQLVQLWHHLMTSSSLVARVFRTDSYEWMLAVVCFFVFIHGFSVTDQAVRNASQKGEIHPWRKYRLQDRFEADKRRRMMDKRAEAEMETVGGVANEKWKIEIDHPKSNRLGNIFQLMVYCVPLLTWDILAPRRHRRLAPFGAPTTLGIMGGITAGLLVYDFLFFCGHVIMHKVPLIYRTIHAKHHKLVESKAGEVVRLTLVEEVLEVGISIIGLNLLGVHPLARSIYNCIITFLLVELHCGFDFPWTPQNIVPFGLATGSRRHHYHHRNGKHYYQKFFFTFDRVLGFFQKDDGSVHGDSVKQNAFIPPAWLNS